MCTRFVYRGDNIITGFNFDIDIVEWNHKIINTKDCFYIGIMRPDGMRHSYHGVNRNGNVGTLLYVHGNLSGTYQDSKDCITIADLVEQFIQAEVSFDDVLQILKERKWTVYLKSDVKINQFLRFDDDILTAIENKMVKN
ncbi:hypothetical protein [Faecalimonas umbilicata]|jgi:hypothetical protein|uniref:hypothetical protein n=1 Tax=Faecalimonas umbilicata TaxID=1912855 RepID=UPI0026991B80